MVLRPSGEQATKGGPLDSTEALSRLASRCCSRSLAVASTVHPIGKASPGFEPSGIDVVDEASDIRFASAHRVVAPQREEDEPLDARYTFASRSSSVTPVSTDVVYRSVTSPSVRLASSFCLISSH